MAKEKSVKILWEPCNTVSEEKQLLRELKGQAQIWVLNKGRLLGLLRARSYGFALVLD
jgi:hypothetical protein